MKLMKDVGGVAAIIVATAIATNEVMPALCILYIQRVTELSQVVREY